MDQTVEELMTGTPKVTVKELDELIKKLFEQDILIEKKEEELTELNKEYSRLKYRAAAHLKELDRDSYITDLGRVEFKEKWRVKLPEDDLKREEVYKYIGEKHGEKALWGMLSIHAGKFKAFYNREWDAAKERGEGVEFSMPGVSPPVMDTIPEFKPARKKKEPKDGE